jgi:hypothetical protein
MRPLDGQWALFGGLCPTCGVVQAYVEYQRSRGRVLRCAICHALVQDLSCGFANAKGTPRSGHRG